MKKSKQIPDFDPIRYKGYWIRLTLPGDAIFIEKDGFHIGYANSIDDAKNTIDMLANPKRTPKVNAGRGKGFTFHGSFSSKILAARKEKEIPGSFIHQKDGRYYVLKPKKVRTNAGIRARASGRVRTRAKNPNPKGGILIYKDVTRIEGTKGKDSHYAGQKFFHNFKRPYPEMLGLSDGSILIRPKR